MRTANKLILSTAYLPPVAYMRAIAKHDLCYIEGHENYSKQSYRNRCIIATANGPLNLVIPVKKVKQGKTLVTKVLIDNDYKWQILHWRAIVSAYKNSPYFEFYEADILPFYTRTFNNLFDFNLLLTNYLIKNLKIKTTISITEKFSEIYDDNTEDLRYAIHPKKEISKFSPQAYKQVFSEKFGFLPNLCIIDLLFNTGPSAAQFLGIR